MSACGCILCDCRRRATGGQRLLLLSWPFTTLSMFEHPRVVVDRHSTRASELSWRCTGWDTGPESGLRRRFSVFQVAGPRGVRESSWIA